mmetsp:Transcript_33899/g.59798  ORF Transcript_33899/g.59798 Transcript_33899/m.59798 type:complete len:80 (+) Transcript_33899:1271-1510(+)
MSGPLRKGPGDMAGPLRRGRVVPVRRSPDDEAPLGSFIPARHPESNRPSSLWSLDSLGSAHALVCKSRELDSTPNAIKQ